MLLNLLKCKKKSRKRKSPLTVIWRGGGSNFIPTVDNSENNNSEMVKSCKPGIL